MPFVLIPEWWTCPIVCESWGPSVVAWIWWYKSGVGGKQWIPSL